MKTVDWERDRLISPLKLIRSRFIRSRCSVRVSDGVRITVDHLQYKFVDFALVPLAIMKCLLQHSGMTNPCKCIIYVAVHRQHHQGSATHINLTHVISHVCLATPKNWWLLAARWLSRAGEWHHVTWNSPRGRRAMLGPEDYIISRRMTEPFFKAGGVDRGRGS